VSIHIPLEGLNVYDFRSEAFKSCSAWLYMESKAGAG